jgi:hypothetical protein
MSNVTRLLEYATAWIRSSQPDRERLVQMFGADGSTLGHLLALRNGFYAFDGALHVLSDIGDELERGVVAWNDRLLWRADYDGMADDAGFFAEDVFGVQFCLRGGAVFTFDPETGRFEMTAKSIDEWFSRIVDDSNTLTGWPIAREWNRIYGPVPRGKRLVPTIPFVLGGELTIANLKPLDAVDGMKFRASIARQIKDLPEGAKVELKVID